MKTNSNILTLVSLAGLFALNACKPDHENILPQSNKQAEEQKQTPATLDSKKRADKCPAFKSASILKEAAIRQQAIGILKDIDDSVLSWSTGQESNTTKRLKELVTLQAWLSSTEGYGNIVLSAQCEWKSMERIVKGVIDGKLPASDAKLMLNSLRDNRFDRKAIGRIVSGELGESSAAQAIAESLQTGQMQSLTKAALVLLDSQGLDAMSLPENKVKIIDEPNIAHAVLFFAMTTRFSGWSEGLIEYVLAGGDVSLNEKDLVKDASMKLPQFFVSLSELTGEKEGPDRIAYLIKKWSN